MTLFGGIVGGACYTGFYDWEGAVQDLEKVKQRAKDYSLPYREVLGVWFDTHKLIQEYSDLLEKAANQLYQDKVIDDNYWEEEVLLISNSQLYT